MSEDSKPQRIVAKKQLVSLLKDHHLKKKRSQSIAGEIGERVKNAVENGNLHRGVYSLMLKLYGMDEVKRNDFLRLFPLYVDMCREEGLFGSEHVGDLLDEKQGEDEPGRDEDAEAAERNAAALEKGIKPLDEDGDKEFDDSTSSKPSRRKAKGAGDGAEASGSYTIHH